MKAASYHAELSRQQVDARIETYAEVVEEGVRYPLLRITSEGRHRLLVTAGFHGNEVAGPLTLAAYLPELVNHARARDVGLTIYPLINPSGFDAMTRYNKSGEQPNNDFMRYVLSSGELAEELLDGAPFVGYQLFRGGPKETQALRADVERQPRPFAALDIHQDPYLRVPLVYAYAFGGPDPYRALIEESEAHAPIARSFTVDTHVNTDEHGLIALHDGSITDWFHREGVALTAALETTTVTPLDVCHRVNLIWLHGFIDLVAGLAPGRPPG